MKRLIAVLVAVAVVAAAIAVPALATTRTVKVGPRTRFTRSERTLRSLTIHKGDKIKFEFTGSLPHNVRIAKGPTRRRTITRTHRRGYEKTRTFTRAGTYTIVCDIHAPNMKFTLHVR
jgi:plastocyanin